MKAWKKSAALFSARVVLGNIDQIINICQNYFIIMTDIDRLYNSEVLVT